MIAAIISTNVNKLSYVTYISTTPFARLRNGWIRPPSCLVKYTIFRVLLRIRPKGISEGMPFGYPMLVQKYGFLLQTYLLSFLKSSQNPSNVRTGILSVKEYSFVSSISFILNRQTVTASLCGSIIQYSLIPSVLYK